MRIHYARKRNLPPKDAEFNTYANRSAKYLLDNKSRLNIDGDAITTLGVLMTDWNTTFPKSQDPTQRTTDVTKDKNDLRKELEQQFRLIYGDIPASEIFSAVVA